MGNDMLKNIIGPLLEPMIKEFKPQFERLAVEFSTMSKRTLSVEAAQLEILNRIKSLELKLNEVLKDAGSGKTGTDTSGSDNGS